MRSFRYLLLSPPFFWGVIAANLLWSIAVLGWPPHPELCDAIYSRLPKMLGAMTGQSLSISVWALATLQLQLPEHVTRALSKRVLVLVDEMSAQSIANITWGFATIGVRHSAPARVAIERRATRCSALDFLVASGGGGVSSTTVIYASTDTR